MNATNKEFNPINPDKFYDLTEMTAQEVFEASMNHLIEQGERSYCGSVDECAYNGPNGLMCAAAIFICKYKRRFEGEDWVGVTIDGGAPEDHKELITKIQEFHDGGLMGLNPYCFDLYMEVFQNSGINTSAYSYELFSAYIKEDADED